MKVKQLIKELKKQDQDKEVVYRSGEHGIWIIEVVNKTSDDISLSWN